MVTVKPFKSALVAKKYTTTCQTKSSFVAIKSNGQVLTCTSHQQDIKNSSVVVTFYFIFLGKWPTNNNKRPTDMHYN